MSTKNQRSRSHIQLCTTNNHRCTLTQKCAGRKPSTQGTRISATGLRALQLTGFQHKPSTPNNIIRNNIIRNNIIRRRTRCLAGSRLTTTRATGNGDPLPAGKRRSEYNPTSLVCPLITMIPNGNNIKPPSTVTAGEYTLSRRLCHNPRQLLNLGYFPWGRITTPLGGLVALLEGGTIHSQPLFSLRIPHLLVRPERRRLTTLRSSKLKLQLQHQLLTTFLKNSGIKHFRHGKFQASAAAAARIRPLITLNTETNSGTQGDRRVRMHSEKMNLVLDEHTQTKMQCVKIIN